MKYRLIALDVDGTLLNDDHQISERTKEAILEAYEGGCQIVLCTGRGPSNTLPVLQELGLEGTMITHNGAVIVQADEQGQSVLYEFSFPLESILPMLEYARRENIHFDVCTAFNMYIERIGEKEKKMYQHYLNSPKMVVDVAEVQLPIVKLTLFAEPDILDRVEQDWEEQRLYGSLQMIRSGDLFIDVMSPLANKGNALRELASSFQIDAAEIMAVGNYYNDVAMIRFAGLGIAVANSPEDVKAAADAVTCSNNEDGVYVAIKKYCL